MNPTRAAYDRVLDALAGLSCGPAVRGLMPDTAPVGPVVIVDPPAAVERTALCVWEMSCDVRVYPAASSAVDSLLDLTDETVTALQAAGLPAVWRQEWREQGDSTLPIYLISTDFGVNGDRT